MGARPSVYSFIRVLVLVMQMYSPSTFFLFYKMERHTQLCLDLNDHNLPSDSGEKSFENQGIFQHLPVLGRS